MERIAAFKAAANATQPPYGTIHHAAVVLTLEKAEIVPPKRMYDVSKYVKEHANASTPIAHSVP